MASKVEQWRTFGQKAAMSEAQELELPSGMVILARRPGPAFIANYARLPLTLTSKLSDERPLGSDTGEQSNQQANFAEFLRELLVYSVLDPGISLAPGPDQIHPRDIPNEDFEFIIGWALRRHEAESLGTFRSQQHDGPTGNDSTDLRTAAVESAGHPGSDAGAGFRPGGDGRVGQD